MRISVDVAAGLKFFRPGGNMSDDVDPDPFGGGTATWQPAKVTRVGGRFDVRVVNPDRPATVDLRLTATAPGGLAAQEEVTAAYAVR